LPVSRYLLQGIAFGAGYFAKLPVAKALSETESTFTLWARFRLTGLALYDARGAPAAGSLATAAGS
jgi:hypothetical protein